MSKVLYLRTDLTTQKVVAGGSIAHTIGVVKGLLAAGTRVVCATYFMPEQIAVLGPEHVKRLTIPRPCARLWWRVLSLLSNLFFFFQILPLFDKNDPFDAIYQRYGLFNFTGVLLSTFKRVPLILEFNGSEVWVDKNWSTQRRWGKLLWLSSLIERLNLHTAHTIIVVSEVLKETLVTQGIAPEKILINPNGVDVIEYDARVLTHQRQKLRHQLDVDDRFVFGFIGSFSVWHGVEMLGNIIPHVAAEQPRAHFLLIGDGPLKSKLERSLAAAGIGSDVVTFTGSVPQEKGREYLAACDAYLSPTQPNKDGSRFFGSPTKIFEYMSLGKPIIASRLEQITEILEPAYFGAATCLAYNGAQKNKDACGILVLPEDTDGFVAACCSLIEQGPALCEQLGAQARKKAEREHTWDQHVTYIQRFFTRFRGAHAGR